MSIPTCCCCEPDEPAPVELIRLSTTATEGPALERSTFRRRILDVVSLAVSATLFALVPKCPVCVATYVALFTGLGISLSLAASLRWGMLAVAVLAATTVAIRTLPRMLRRSS